MRDKNIENILKYYNEIIETSFKEKIFKQYNIDKIINILESEKDIDNRIIHSKKVATTVVEIAESYSEFTPIEMELMIVSSLLHDIKKEKNNNAEHSEKGAQFVLTSDILKELYSKENLQIISTIIEYHNRGRMIVEENIDNKSIRKYAKIVHDADKISKIYKEKILYEITYKKENINTITYEIKNKLLLRNSEILLKEKIKDIKSL